MIRRPGELRRQMEKAVKELKDRNLDMWLEDHIDRSWGVTVLGDANTLREYPNSAIYFPVNIPEDEFGDIECIVNYYTTREKNFDYIESQLKKHMPLIFERYEKIISEDQSPEKEKISLRRKCELIYIAFYGSYITEEEIHEFRKNEEERKTFKKGE